MRAAALLVLLSAATAAAAEPTATLREVRQILTPETTRLIIELSRPAHYRLQRSAGRPELGVPPRVVLDLAGVQLPAGVRLPNAFNEGPLLRLRATAPSADAARLVLDVPGLTDLGAFVMPDPFRIIVDVRGSPRAAAMPSARPHPRTAALPPRPPGLADTGHRPRLKIVVDPGHGGKDPGASAADGVAEKDVTLAIAQRLARRLQIRGFDVVLTRDTDVFVPLEQRTARANTEHADVFVSIHTNASANDALSGVETYYLNNTNDRATIRLAEMENGLRAVTGHARGDAETARIVSDLIQSYKVQESVTLAEDVQRGLIGALDAHGTATHDLGVKRGPFYVLVGAGMPCVLAEVSFLTHPAEGARLRDPVYQDSIAEGLLRGIERFVENSRMADNL